MQEFAKAISLFADTAVLSVIPVAKNNYELLGLHDDIEDGVRVVRLYFRKAALFNKAVGFFMFLKGVRYLSRKNYEPDIVNAHVFYSAVPVILSSHTLDKPLIVTEHSTDFLRPRGPGILRGKIYAWVAKRAKLVMPVSHHLRKAMQGYSKAEYSVFPNIYDPKIFYYKKTESNKKKVKLIYAGGLIQRKGIDILLTAVSGLKNKNIFLALVGDGPEQEKYEQLSRDLGVSRNITFYGHKNHREIADLMRKSDIYVHGSRSETFGCVLMEAMACGLPVVAAGVGGVPEVVDKESGILVASGDIEAFKNAILRILLKPAEYNRKNIAARAFKRFSREKAGKKLINIFTRQISAAGREQK